MSEGPQVKLRTKWLARHLDGRRVLTARSSRPDLATVVETLRDREVTRCFCHGKHIFVEFSGGLTLHNHLLMRGKWRREPGQLLLLPAGIWLALYVGPYTICNLNGQRLELLDPAHVAVVRGSLGPDVMTDPFPEMAVRAALQRSDLPVAEALLDQSVVCGLGNIARSEALFTAGISPFTPARSLTADAFQGLCRAIHDVMWASFAAGGRWVHRVYRRAGQPCPKCGRKIQLVKLRPSRRSAYFCPHCQATTSSKKG